MRALEVMYTETAAAIEETLMGAAKKMNCCNVKVSSALGRGKKLQQTMREGTARQKIGSPQMLYSIIMVDDPTKTGVHLSHRGFWEITRDDATNNLQKGDLVHEASNAWGDHAPQVCACATGMPAQMVVPRGTRTTDFEQVDTTWARQWAKQARRIHKLLAYRRLAFKAVTLSEAGSTDWLRCAKATTAAPGFGKQGFLGWASKILNEKWMTAMAMPTSTLLNIQGYLQKSIKTEVHRVKATRRKEFRRKLFGDTQQGLSLHQVDKTGTAAASYTSDV